MECEVCGEEIFGRAHKTVIDGAKLLICSECAQHAPTSWQPEPEKPRVPVKKPAPTVRPMRAMRAVRARAPPQALMSDDLVLVEDYGRSIRGGREKLGLTHEELSRKIGERVSLLQKLETEKIVPDRSLAKKLENALRVKILVPPPKIQVSEEMLAKKPVDLTLGDVVVMQKKKKS